MLLLHRYYDLNILHANFYEHSILLLLCWPLVGGAGSLLSLLLFYLRSLLLLVLLFFLFYYNFFLFFLAALLRSRWSCLGLLLAPW